MSNIEEYYTKYIQELDPTEYYYATRVFGSWSLWEQFVDDNKDLVNSWRRELEAKIKSMCLSSLIETSRGETRDALAAAKFLLDAPWVKDENKRGRPSKMEIDNELKSQAEIHQRIKEDLERIGHASP
jgi:hypothetical protein